MIGCKPLTPTEVAAIAKHLSCARDRCLFILGLRTGLRISELLSLKVSNVFSTGSLMQCIYIERRNTKGKTAGRSIALHNDAREAIASLLATWDHSPGDWLFQSFRTPNKPLDRVMAYRILREATDKAKIAGKVATHSMRKTFAERMYTKLDKDLLKLQKALGHRDVNSTIAYLSFNQQDIDDAILSD